MSDRVLSGERVVEKTGLSRTTIWRMEKRGDFPDRIKLSPNRVGWLESDVDEWIESRSHPADGSGS